MFQALLQICCTLINQKPMENHEHGIWGELIGKNLTGKD